MSIESRSSRGIGSLTFAVIPAALAGAALMWLAFFTGIVDWQKVQRIEGRMDGRVGVSSKLSAPVEVIIENRSCVKIDRAFLDGLTVTMYLQNQCHKDLGYYEWHWMEVAPDGTTIKEDFGNSIDGLSEGQKVEKVMDLTSDTRTAKIVVWAKGD
jgi:hypothetical protein